MNTRVLQQELLETYPDDHPDAMVARSELLLVNEVMGNHRWIKRTLRRTIHPGWSIVEMGAGDGALSRQFWQEGICAASRLHGMDLAQRPADWPLEAAWSQGDLFAMRLPESEVLVANLFLHHFTDEQLHLLGSRISPKTCLILAVEPERRWLHTLMGRFFCWLAELHPITRFDMQVSIRAGFRGDELASALGVDARWRWQARTTWFGGYRFIAIRDD
jgi:hypothetical protein